MSFEELIKHIFSIHATPVQYPTHSNCSRNKEGKMVIFNMQATCNHTSMYIKLIRQL